MYFNIWASKSFLFYTQWQVQNSCRTSSRHPTFPAKKLPFEIFFPASRKPTLSVKSLPATGDLTEQHHLFLTDKIKIKKKRNNKVSNFSLRAPGQPKIKRARFQHVVARRLQPNTPCPQAQHPPYYSAALLICQAEESERTHTSPHLLLAAQAETNLND